MTKFGAAERYSDLQRPLAASHTFFPNHCRQRALDGQSVLTQAPFARWTAHDRADSCAVALSPAGIGGQCSKTYSQRTCSLARSIRTVTSPCQPSSKSLTEFWRWPLGEQQTLA